MKLTKAAVTSFVRKQLGTNPTWAVKALVRIYKENQTAMEQAAGVVVEDNGIGFTGTDGPFLSSLAKHFIDKDWLSEKQLSFVLLKMPKYHKQVIAMSNAETLEKMVLKDVAP